MEFPNLLKLWRICRVLDGGVETRARTRLVKDELELELELERFVAGDRTILLSTYIFFSSDP